MDSPDEVQQPPAPRTRSRMDSIPREEWERILTGDHPPVVRAAAAPPEHPPELSRRVSRQHSSERGQPPPTSVALPAVDLRRASLLQRAGSQRSLRNTSGSGYISSASDGLEPVISIGVNPRTINAKGQHFLDNMDDAERQWESAHNSTSTGSGRSKVDRDVIVTSEHSGTSISTPTPLGRPRRQSLFERANGGSMSEFANMAAAAGVPQGDWGVSEHNNSSLQVLKVKEVDSLKLEDGDPPEDPPAVERDQYHTVLRDWLLHVVEKDDDQDTKVRRESSKYSVFCWWDATVCQHCCNNSAACIVVNHSFGGLACVLLASCTAVRVNQIFE